MDTKNHNPHTNSKYTEDFKVERPEYLTVENVFHWSNTVKEMEKMVNESKTIRPIIRATKQILQNEQIEKTGETPEGNKRWIVKYQKSQVTVLYSKKLDAYYCDCTPHEMDRATVPCKHALAAELFELINGRSNENKSIQEGKETD